MNDDRREPTTTRGRMAHPLLWLPLLVPVIVLVFTLISRTITDKKPENIDTAARALVGQELHRIRAKYDQENAQAAYTSAQGFVRSRLLPAGAAVTASFPDTTGEKIRSLSVTPSYGGKYRVRANVEWRDTNGAIVRRRFETDMRLGPTDNHWRLIDTEFLP